MIFEINEDPLPRFVTIPTSSSQGFSLVNHPAGHFVSRLTPGGLAEQAGLRINDRIIEINKENVETTPHQEVVDIIRLCGEEEISLLVVDRNYDSFWDEYEKTKTVQLLKNPDAMGFAIKFLGEIM